jgi:hypothetical protein
MKKLIFIITLLCSFIFVQAQNGKQMTFSPASNDSLVGAVTKYCTLSAPITGKWTGSIYIYLSQSVVGTDSTRVTVEGSQDNVTFYAMNMGTPYIGGTAAIRAAGYYVTCTAGNAWIMWNPTWYIAPPYLRLKVQHYVATASVKITKANIYLKR